MSDIAPLEFFWNSMAMMPINRHARTAHKQYVEGCIYRLGVIEERSAATHSHFFAVINEAWQNLPEEMAERFPTSEHLRKYALIKTGFADSQTFVCASKAEAQRMAAFVKPIDEFSIVSVKEACVTLYRAKSQSQRAMGKEDFQASKEAVLNWLSDLLRVSPSSLTGAAA